MHTPPSSHETVLARNRELETLFNVHQDGIVTINIRGSIQSINPAFSNITGLNSAKLLGLSEPEFDHFLGLQLEQAPANFERIAGHHPENHKTYLRNADKANRQVEKNIVISRKDILVSAGGILKILYFSDVTEIIANIQAQSDFLVKAAHELRSPMTSILGFSELLLSSNYDLEATQEISALLHQQATDLLALLNQVFDIVRFNAGGANCEFKAQALLPIVDTAINTFNATGVPNFIRRSKTKSNYQIFADAARLSQALTHLFDNAYLYAETKYIDLEIAQRQRGTQREIGVIIRDYGKGLDNRQIDQMFTPFWRAKHPGIPSNGLGLYLVKKIMDAHQGHIDVESRPGVGTTISLWLNLASS